MHKKLIIKAIHKSIIAAFFISMLINLCGFTTNCERISTQVFRLHVLANSNSDEDQNLKLKVKDKINEYTASLLSGDSNKYEAEKIIQENLEDIKAIGQKEVYKNGYDYIVNASLENSYFNTRKYDTFTLPAGNYDALKVTIGSGQGKNWWCVVFPELCVATAEDEKKLEDVLDDKEVKLVTDDDRYHLEFKSVEIYENIKRKLNSQSN